MGNPLLAYPTLDRISLLSVVGQLLAVSAVSFVVLTLAMSHFRYQRLIRDASVSLRAGGSRGDLRLCLADALGRRVIALLLIRSSGDPGVLAAALRGRLRGGDQILFPSEDALLLWLEPMDAEHLPRVAHRLAPLLRESADRGRVDCLHLPMQSRRDSRLDAAEKAIEGFMAGGLPDEGWSLPPAPGPYVPLIPEEQKTLLDEVTGVLHPLRVSSAVQKILAGHRRRLSPVCLVLASVDELQAYGESFGAEGSNAVLREAARQWMCHCRESDLIGRLDEDTLVICMAGEPEPVLEAVRRVAAVMRQNAAVCGTQELHYTLSAAVVAYPRDAVGPSKLFHLARRTLDAARERGRGLVLAYEPSLLLSQTAPARREAEESF